MRYLRDLLVLPEVKPIINHDQRPVLPQKNGLLRQVASDPRLNIQQKLVVLDENWSLNSGVSRDKFFACFNWDHETGSRKSDGSRLACYYLASVYLELVKKYSRFQWSDEIIFGIYNGSY